MEAQNQAIIEEEDAKPTPDQEECEELAEKFEKFLRPSVATVTALQRKEEENMKSFGGSLDQIFDDNVSKKLSSLEREKADFKPFTRRAARRVRGSDGSGIIGINGRFSQESQVAYAHSNQFMEDIRPVMSKLEKEKQLSALSQGTTDRSRADFRHASRVARLKKEEGLHECQTNIAYLVWKDEYRKPYLEVPNLKNKMACIRDFPDYPLEMLLVKKQSKLEKEVANASESNQPRTVRQSGDEAGNSCVEPLDAYLGSTKKMSALERAKLESKGMYSPVKKSGPLTARGDGPTESLDAYLGSTKKMSALERAKLESKGMYSPVNKKKGPSSKAVVAAEPLESVLGSARKMSALERAKLESKGMYSPVNKKGQKGPSSEQENAENDVWKVVVKKSKLEIEKEKFREFEMQRQQLEQEKKSTRFVPTFD